MSKKLLSLTLSALVAASSASLPSVFAAKDKPDSSESGSTRSTGSSGATMSVSSVPFTSAHAGSNSSRDDDRGSNDADSGSKKRSRNYKKDDSAPSKKRRKSSDSSSSSSDDDSDYKAPKVIYVPVPVAPPVVKPPVICKNLNQVFLEKYAYCEAHKDYSKPDLSMMTENTGWALVNKKLPDSYITRDGIKKIQGFNKYFRVSHNGKTYVMLLPTFMMVSQAGLSTKEVKNLALNPKNWEFVYVDNKKLFTYNSEYRYEGLVNSLDEYIGVITPDESERG